GVSDTSLSIGARPSSANTRSHAVACCFCSDARYSYSAVSASPTGHQSAWSPFGRSVKQFVRGRPLSAAPPAPRRLQVSLAPCATTALLSAPRPVPSRGEREPWCRSSRPPSQSGGRERVVCGPSPPPPPRKIRGYTRGVLLGVPGVAAVAPRGRRARPRAVARASGRLDGEAFSSAPSLAIRSPRRGPRRGPDAGHDAVPDAVPDAGPDAVTDAGPDAVPDAVPDAGTDAVPDAGPDAGPDAVTDAGPDAGPDAVTDAVPDAGPDADTGAVPDAGPD